MTYHEPGHVKKQPRLSYRRISVFQAIQVSQTEADLTSIFNEILSRLS